MKNLTADQILHKTFEYLDQVLDQNSQNNLEEQEKTPELLTDSEKSPSDEKESRANIPAQINDL